jgi:hypothetical protein
MIRDINNRKTAVLARCLYGRYRWIHESNRATRLAVELPE